MYWNVVHVAAISNSHLYVKLKNGQFGIFDVSKYWHLGILKELQNPYYFKQVMILYGSISWPNGQDIAPETLLADLQAVKDGPVHSAPPPYGT